MHRKDKNIQVLFVDVDNTLLDFRKGALKCVRRAFLECNIVYPEVGGDEAFEKATKIVWDEIEKGLYKQDEIQEKALNRRFYIMLDLLGLTGDGLRIERLFRNYIADSAELMDGAFEFLDKLSKKYKLYAATNGPHRQQVNRLTISNLLPFFTDVYTSEIIGFDKPSSNYFKKCLEIGDIKKEEVLMIGDSLSADIIGGNEFGIKTCFINWKQIDIPKGQEPTYCFNTLKEALQFLE